MRRFGRSCFVTGCLTAMQGVPARFSFLELSLVAGRNDLYSLHYGTSSDLPTPYLTKFSLPPDRFLAKTSSLSIAKRYTHPKQVESSSRLTPAVSELCQVLAHLPNAHRMHVLVHTAHAAKFNTIIARFNPDFQASQIEVTSIGPIPPSVFLNISNAVILLLLPVTEPQSDRKAPLSPHFSGMRLRSLSVLLF